MSSYLDVMRNGNFEVIPYHGRDYRSARDAEADWNANRDFIVRASGTMTISRSACEGTVQSGSTIFIRYNRLRDVVPIVFISEADRSKNRPGRFDGKPIV